MRIGKLEMEEHPDIATGMCLVTPHDAEELLKRNTHNRPPSQMVTQKYETEMRMGDWYPAASGIGIDTNGVMTDGQHRLAAIIKSGEPQWLLITTNLPPESQRKHDRQFRRSLPQVFALAGICSHKKTVQIATFLARCTAEDFRTGVYYGSVSDSEVEAAIANHKPALEAIASIPKDASLGIGLVGYRAALVLAYEIHGEKVIKFANEVGSELHTRYDDPAFRLRKTLLENGSSGGGNRQVRIFRKTVAAFNAWVTGRKTNCLKEEDEIVAPQ